MRERERGRGLGGVKGVETMHLSIRVEISSL